MDNRFAKLPGQQIRVMAAFARDQQRAERIALEHARVVHHLDLLLEVLS